MKYVVLLTLLSIRPYLMYMILLTCGYGWVHRPMQRPELSPF
jgi:hypothetical protein